MVTDGLGNPLRFLLSCGNRSDLGMAQELLSPFDLSGKLVLADKGYDSDKLADRIKGCGGITVIPSRRSAVVCQQGYCSPLLETQSQRGEPPSLKSP